MAEQLKCWPRGGGAWEGGLAEAPAPQTESWRCECGGVKGWREQRCRRCYLAIHSERRERIRLMLATHRPREVAAFLGVDIATVYAARRRR